MKKTPASRRHVGYIDDYRPIARTRKLLVTVKDLLDEYQPYWPLTVRQVFYALVGRWPEHYPKTEQFYDSLSEHISNARRARYSELNVLWESITDSGVTISLPNCFDDEADFWRAVGSTGESFEKNLLIGQPRLILVVCEAAGMVESLARVAHRYSIPVFSAGGFESTDLKKKLSERIVDAGKPASALLFRDHDPSGQVMANNIDLDVGAFVTADRIDARTTVDFVRVALTDDQVAHYGLPTEPPKKSSHATSLNWTGGTTQLEALPPDEIARLLDAAIRSRLDLEQLERDRAAAETERERILRKLSSLR